MVQGEGVDFPCISWYSNGMNLHNVKTFELAGITYPVKYVREVNEDAGTNGMAFLDKGRVDILESLSPDKRGQVFCHELTHCILSTMGETALNENEKFVDLFGSFLHQVLKTIK